MGRSQWEERRGEGGGWGDLSGRRGEERAGKCKTVKQIEWMLLQLLTECNISSNYTIIYPPGGNTCSLLEYIVLL